MRARAAALRGGAAVPPCPRRPGVQDVNPADLYSKLVDRLTERKVFGEIVLRLKKHGLMRSSGVESGVIQETMTGMFRQAGWTLTSDSTGLSIRRAGFTAI